MNTHRLAMMSRRSAESSWAQRIEAWWLGLPAALRQPWPMALALATIFALLLGFHQVVKESVRQGELLRMNTATHAQAVWRCHALNTPRKRTDCLAQLNAPERRQASIAPPPNTAALRAAPSGS